jgi:hypothetical protein
MRMSPLEEAAANCGQIYKLVRCLNIRLEEERKVGREIKEKTT